MINEEVGNRLVTLNLRLAKSSAKMIIAALKLVIKEAESKKLSVKQYISQKSLQGEVPLKDLVGKGTLENIHMKQPELLELKKELNKHGVRFSVLKNKENKNFEVFFQAKDTAVLEHSFKQAVERAERKTKIKQSTLKKIQQYQKSLGQHIIKPKIKQKHQEQSL
uniref:PcfB family protein n=1 Tax=Streptococcus suis TaxID=1307 RepID=UPI000CF3AB68|nr:PcfB family protein [Streptococcus suis]